MSNIDNFEILGRPIFQGRLQCTKMTIINMYLLIEIGHNFHIKCHGDHIEMKKENYMLEIDPYRNSSRKNLGVPKGHFSGFGCPRHPGG